MEAPNKATQIKAAITAIIATGTALWGTTGWTIIIFLMTLVLDYITGTAAAIKAGEWSSENARQGLWHKFGEIVALCGAALCDIALAVVVESSVGDRIADVNLPSSAFTLLVAVWYAFTEIGSIIENAGKLGAPIPAWLCQIIAKLKTKSDPFGTDVEAKKGENTTPEDTPRD